MKNVRPLHSELFSTFNPGRQKLCKGTKTPKSLDPDENFKPEHTLFCRKLRFVAIYALFGDLWTKKAPFWVKNENLMATYVDI